MTGEYADREKRPEPKRNERSIYDPVYEEPKPTSDELDVTAIPGYGADYAKDYPALQGDTFAALIAAHTKETTADDLGTPEKKTPDTGLWKMPEDLKAKDKDTRIAQGFPGEGTFQEDPITKLIKIIIGGIVVGTAATMDAAHDLYRDVMRSEKKDKDNLPKDKDGRPVPDSEHPHTQLGERKGRKGSYRKTREWGKDGKLEKDTDWTDHGRPKDHPNPHQHRWLPNSTGGTPQRGPAEPMK
jgi:hypothetical protein